MSSRKVHVEGNGDGSQPPDLENEFLVVGIGASAGGISALSEFFSNVAADSGMAYVVILHLSPDHDSQLASVLQQVSDIPVEQVTRKTRIQPNNVYVVPPDRSLTMRDGYILVKDIKTVEERRAPVDIFFRTLAESHGPNAVGVILSGTGSNGSMGIKRIKEMGGIAVVQNPREAEHGEMPRSSIATELVDSILPVAGIPGYIRGYRNNRSGVTIANIPDGQPESEQAYLREIFTQLRTRTGHDFSNYKRPTMMRRIERRIGVRGLPDLRTYASYLKQNPEESQALLKDLLISVTNFFRDRKAFAVLEKKIFPQLLNKMGSGSPVRIWVAGCATGEEAYSLAMIAAEQTSGDLEAGPVQIFASDIDDQPLAIAREGLYTINDAADVSPGRLKRFFTKEGNSYRVRREIREMVLFAQHNLLKDPPFSRIDLISCRNVLIYLNHRAQERVLETFHFALNPGGYLFVGTSESLDAHSDLYASVDKASHVYQAREIAQRRLPTPDSTPTYRAFIPPPTAAPEATSKSKPGQVTVGDLHLRLLEQFSPPSVVVNESFDIVHVSPSAGAYLQVAGGEPTNNLLHLLRPEIRIALRTALSQAVREQTNVEVKDVTVHMGNTEERINILVRPVLGEQDTARGFLLIVFKPTAAEGDEAEKAVSAQSEDAARRLEEELVRSRTQLQTALSQSEVQAEELHASNEELQAMNEELRSSAEELETSREELQSTNEELTTVNQELKIKIDELSETNNNFQNLINSIDIGTVFLDRSFRVNLFSPAARDIFNFRDNDNGRPITDITTRLNYPDLINDASRVLEDLQTLERELSTIDGQYFLMRIYPYKTQTDKINGVIVTFVDITERKRLSASRRESDEQFRRAIEEAPIPVIMHAEDGEVLQISRSWTELTGYTIKDVPTVDDWLTRAYGEGADEVRTYVHGLFRGEESGKNIPFQIKTANGDIRHWSFSASPPGTLADGRRFVIGMALDITDRKLNEEAAVAERHVEEALQLSEDRLRQVVESVTDYAILTTDANSRITSWNIGAEKIFGWTGAEAIGKSADMIFTPEDLAKGEADKEREIAKRDGRAPDERFHIRKDGSRFYVSGVMTLLRDSRGEIAGYAKIARDMTERRNIERALQDKEMLQKLVAAQEEERKRFARDLHDELGQQLTVLRMKLDTIRSSCKNGETQAQIDEIERLARSVDEGVDFMAWEMRPAALDDLGLVVALDKFAKQWSYHSGIDAELIGSTIRKVRFDPNIEINFYRIAQEALNNIQKHSKATGVDLMLERRGQTLVMVIEDNGKGFNTKNKKYFAKGLGLSGMRERAELIGGMLEIESAPRKGTTIYVTVPAMPLRREK